MKHTKQSQRTEIEYSISSSEEGGNISLRVSAPDQRTATRVFNKLHKKYCLLNSPHVEIAGYN